jgi:hypothetical protein
MTQRRLRFAFWTMAVLVGLLVFNEYRWSLVAACHRSGGVWDGRDSKCRLIPARLFLDHDDTQPI